MNKQDKIYKNPFNYNGSKERILPLIKQNLPQNCTMLVDMFGGSGTLCVNTDFAMYIYNEKNKYMCNLFVFFIFNKIVTHLIQIIKGSF